MPPNRRPTLINPPRAEGHSQKVGFLIISGSLREGMGDKMFTKSWYCQKGGRLCPLPGLFWRICPQCTEGSFLPIVLGEHIEIGITSNATRLCLHSFGPLWTISTRSQWETSEVGRLSCFIEIFAWFHIVCGRYRTDWVYFTITDTIWPLSFSWVCRTSS